MPQSRRGRRAAVPALCCCEGGHGVGTVRAGRDVVLLVLLLVAAGLGLVGCDVADRDTTARTEPAPPSPAAAVCGVADTAAISVTGDSRPPVRVRVLPGTGMVSALVVLGARLYVLDAAAGSIRVLTPDGAALSTVSLGGPVGSSLAVDHEGSLFVVRSGSTVVKLAAEGAEIWARDVGAPIEGLFTVGKGSGFRLGVVRRGTDGSDLFDGRGVPVGRSNIQGRVFSPTADGGLLSTDGNYVRRYDAAGVETLVFGDSRKANDPSPTGSPFHFYLLGGAVVAPDGTVFVADATRGIHATSPEGFYRGTAIDAAVGSLTEQSWLAIIDHRVYFAAGGRFNRTQTVGWLSFDDLAELARAPKAPPLILGFGAGLLTDVPGQYFPPGSAPAVHARFDPWWQRHGKELTLRYTVRDWRQVVRDVEVAPTAVTLPSTESGLRRIPLAVPAARAGAYEVDARLETATGGVIGSTCLRYTVGAANHRLDFSTLPPGSDWGGPGPARGVALAGDLGTGGLRGRLEWSKLLPDPTGRMRFEVYDELYANAAREAAARGVAFWVQVGEGGPVEKALVENGRWEQRVAELVSHYRGRIPAWEAWNEPKDHYPAEAYVSKVLAPFSRAVRSADPGAKVIGGSTAGIPLDYWRDIISSGGAALLDIVGIHPYTGHNRSWEEHGTPQAIQQLKEILASGGAGSKPIWNTESGFWGDGPSNYYSHGDKVARALLWQRVLGIERWSYFLLEGGYGDYGFSYSLIQGASEPDFVKPAALAAMTASSAIEGRPFTGFSETGIPHAYAAIFGSRPGGSDSVVAVWTDDLEIMSDVTVRAAGGPAMLIATDVLGATSELDVTPGRRTSLALSGSPVYVTAPTGAGVRIKPVKRTGPNLAAAREGTSVTATSSTLTNPPESATDGLSQAGNRGDLPEVSAWASAPNDPVPALVVRLHRPAKLDRILVSTHSLGSIVPGLRNYDVAIQGSKGRWVTVARVRDQFHARRRLIVFSRRQVRAIRVTVSAVNFGGVAGGLQPWSWRTDEMSLSDERLPWYGPAVVTELEAYGDPSRAGRA